MKGMGTNITEKDSQWILKIHFLCTLNSWHAQCLPIGIWGRAGLGTI